MDNHKNEVLIQAVDAVVNSFRKHSEESSEEIDAVEALQEFWQMKHTRGSDSGTKITYEDGRNSSSPVSYVFLPGGSCFGSFESSESRSGSKQSAAKIALMHSVLNEHPSSVIDDNKIEQILSESVISFQLKSSGERQFRESRAAFKNMLDLHRGRSMLRLQEALSVFQLLHWNGSLRAMMSRNCSRDEVIQHYSMRSVDEAMREQMALDWVERENQEEDSISAELERTDAEMKMLRKNGKELRFPKEKTEILFLARRKMNQQ